MLTCSKYLQDLETAVQRSPITALFGPRQVGNTTVARLLTANPPSPRPGSRLTYTITLRNPGVPILNATLTDILPPEAAYFGNPNVSAGHFSQAGGLVAWAGNVSTGVPVTISFEVTLNGSSSGPYPISNTIEILGGSGSIVTRQVVTIANGLSFFLPLVCK
jgi:uncharacterized repeat protein (TIGR01451 family)